MDKPLFIGKEELITAGANILSSSRWKDAHSLFLWFSSWIIIEWPHALNPTAKPHRIINIPKAPDLYGRASQNRIGFKRHCIVLKVDSLIHGEILRHWKIVLPLIAIPILLNLWAPVFSTPLITLLSKIWQLNN